MNYIVVLDLTRKVWQFEGKNHRLCDVREVEYIFVYICISFSWRKEKRRTRRGGWRLITRARRKLVERIEVEIRLLLERRMAGRKLGEVKSPRYRALKIFRMNGGQGVVAILKISNLSAIFNERAGRCFSNGLCRLTKTMPNWSATPLFFSYFYMLR